MLSQMADNAYAMQGMTSAYDSAKGISSWVRSDTCVLRLFRVFLDCMRGLDTVCRRVAL